MASVSACVFNSVQTILKAKADVVSFLMSAAYLFDFLNSTGKGNDDFNPGVQNTMGGPRMGLGAVINEEYAVPDRMVGFSKYGFQFFRMVSSVLPLRQSLNFLVVAAYLLGTIF